MLLEAAARDAETDTRLAPLETWCRKSEARSRKEMFYFFKMEIKKEKEEKKEGTRNSTRCPSSIANINSLGLLVALDTQVRQEIIKKGREGSDSYLPFNVLPYRSRGVPSGQPLHFVGSTSCSGTSRAALRSGPRDWHRGEVSNDSRRFLFFVFTLLPVATIYARRARVTSRQQRVRFRRHSRCVWSSQTRKRKTKK